MLPASSDGLRSAPCKSKLNFAHSGSIASAFYPESKSKWGLVGQLA